MQPPSSHPGAGSDTSLAHKDFCQQVMRIQTGLTGCLLNLRDRGDALTTLYSMIRQLKQLLNVPVISLICVANMALS